ncbi:MAG: asparagine synthase-related protein, partial [Arenimonas sp.]
LLATTPEALQETQPWTDPRTGCVVVTDSRLDNREELAGLLGLADRPIDEIGDAQLIFAAYQKWSDSCPEKLLGDFTFAIWNPATKKIFCARDQLGVRLFYYHYLEGRIFAFATRSEALRPLLAEPTALDEGRLADALTDHLEGYDHVSSFYRDIKRLPPANSLILQMNSPPVIKSFWQPLQNPPSPFPGTEKQWLEQLEALFVEAVQCRLRSHLPIGAMLSGGLDSSAVVAIACEKLQHDNKPKLATFSAVSSHPDCPETRAIRLMQSSFELSSTEVDPEKSPDLMQAIAAQWPHFDEPFEASATLVSAQYLSAQQNNIRIVLDGIDADGLLAEGDFLHELARAGQWRQVWRESRASVRFYRSENTLSYFLRPLVSEFLVPRPVRRVVRYLRTQFRKLNDHTQALISPEFAEKIDLQARYQTSAANSAGSKLVNHSMHQAYCVVATSNTVTAVERYQRQASRWGIEPRHPFLDRRLVEFCAWLPLELRLRDGYPKWALREALSPYLPREITWRRGKEHLGGLFTKALWKYSRQALIKDQLHPWLVEATLANVQTRFKEITNLGTGSVVSENELEPMITLAAVNIWLNALVNSDK